MTTISKRKRQPKMGTRTPDPAGRRKNFFQVFCNQEYSHIAARYPFLTPSQIRKKLATQWSNDKKNKIGLFSPGTKNDDKKMKDSPLWQAKQKIKKFNQGSVFDFAGSPKKLDHSAVIPSFDLDNNELPLDSSSMKVNKNSLNTYKDIKKKTRKRNVENSGVKIKAKLMSRKSKIKKYSDDTVYDYSIEDSPEIASSSAARIYQKTYTKQPRKPCIQNNTYATKNVKSILSRDRRSTGRVKFGDKDVTSTFTYTPQPSQNTLSSISSDRTASAELEKGEWWKRRPTDVPAKAESFDGYSVYKGCIEPCTSRLQQQDDENDECYFTDEDSVEEIDQGEPSSTARQAEQTDSSTKKKDVAVCKAESCSYGSKIILSGGLHIEVDADETTRSVDNAFLSPSPKNLSSSSTTEEEEFDDGEISFKLSQESMSLFDDDFINGSAASESSNRDSPRGGDDVRRSSRPKKANTLYTNPDFITADYRAKRSPFASGKPSVKRAAQIDRKPTANKIPSVNQSDRPNQELSGQDLFSARKIIRDDERFGANGDQSRCTKSDENKPSFAGERKTKKLKIFQIEKSNGEAELKTNAVDRMFEDEGGTIPGSLHGVTDATVENVEDLTKATEATAPKTMLTIVAEVHSSNENHSTSRITQKPIMRSSSSNENSPQLSENEFKWSNVATTATDEIQYLTDGALCDMFQVPATRKSARLVSSGRISNRDAYSHWLTGDDFFL
ncbi:uncharacterized protein LOC141904940 [Tubulanus polymorphus]|uniref:uncharacterized protein LOC141904940 n=1 Tax=Tubulanus polymorphus TaxID=672921 RepID=UPI003DA2F60B